MDGAINMKKKKTKKKNVFIIIICIIIAIFVGAYLYGTYLFSKISKKKLPKSNEELGIKEIPDRKNDNDIVNIAFFGLDRRNPNESSRSDSIMIISIDPKREKVKVTSVMRDTYVSIPGYEDTRINHAYAYAGPLLAIKTINSNFDMDIRNYATVDFFGLEKLIDKVGGVEMDVSAAEADLMNSYIAGINKITGESSNFVNPGTQVLNGRQAVAYSRIRYVGNGDYERTERQRDILNKLFVKIKASGATNIPNLMSTVLPYVETSLTNTEMLDLSMKVMGFDGDVIEQFRIPVDGYFTNQNIRGMAVLVPDIQANKEKLHEFIYEK